MTFRYDGGATGLEVLSWYNSKSHGGTVKGSHSFWDETIDELGGEQGILNLFKENGKKIGLLII